MSEIIEVTKADEKQIVGESYSSRDQELIQQLIQSRLSQKEELEYDPLDDYEVPPRTQFSMLSKPAVVIRRKQLTFSASSIRLFKGVVHILPMASRKRHRLCVVPLSEEEQRSVQWARQKDEKWINKPITSDGFIENIFAFMQWNPKYRYKALGHITNSPRGLVLAFDLDDAIFYTGQTTDFLDEKTGTIRKKKDVFFPKQYKNRIGTPYNDYMNRRQMDLFEDFEDMVILPTKTYDDAVDKDAAEDDLIVGEPQTFSQESEAVNDP